jgi:hypothetical protein
VRFYWYSWGREILISLVRRKHMQPYLLPEFVGEDSGINLDIDISERYFV